MTATPPYLATWTSRLPWLGAFGLAIAGTALTAVGQATGQALQLSETAATLVMAACVAISALLGLLWMKLSHRPLAEYGLRKPTSPRWAVWTTPLYLLPIIVVAVLGIHIGTTAALAYLALTIAVGFNEEIWFRGLILACLRRFGNRTAILGGASLFALLHLTGAAAGLPPAYLVLQLGFAFLVALVFGQILTLSGSLWPAIIWHAVYDFSAFAAGNATTITGRDLLTIGLGDAILAAFALVLWPRIPRHAA